MRNGSVKMIERSRGFGFVTADSVDFFFHRSDMADGLESFPNLYEGDAVSFEEVVPEPPRGRRATHVRLIAAPDTIEAATAEAATDHDPAI